MLLDEFNEIFSNDPGTKNLEIYDIEITENKLIRKDKGIKYHIFYIYRILVLYI